ncbi:MAG: hypothetical protein EAZ85_02655 [Bacteroidetes bacterium]|nr:MAG: hypothetical protein EAZ85_02655 [Bacteroidota bacterium]TAG90249.1 MAG: hypothetical protein EAZ20_04870 [Bacteroidota bacterium]
MTLKETLNQIEQWERPTQIGFCKQIIKNIPISIRSIWSDDSTTCEEKLEGIKWLNEFNHRIDNLIFTLETTPLKEEIDICQIGRYAQDYARENNMTQGEISAIITSAYNRINNYCIQSKIFKEGVHELLKSESFRKRIPMYIGETKISNLESFIGGYYFAESVHKFELTALDLYFENFNDWIMKYYRWKESTAGWKNIILTEMENDETKALQTFLILYDEFMSEREK